LGGLYIILTIDFRMMVDKVYDYDCSYNWYCS